MVWAFLFSFPVNFLATIEYFGPAIKIELVKERILPGQFPFEDFSLRDLTDRGM